MVDFVLGLSWNDIPETAKHNARRSFLDLVGVAAAGTQTQLTRIVRDFACEEFAPGSHGARLFFDGRRCSVSGAALANGMSIDSIDAHDGQKLTKGHVGCGVLPAVLAAFDACEDVQANELLCSLVAGYELGTRAGIALHDSAADFHTSGAWIAIACAAITARIRGLSPEQCKEAMGIAEYHGPRSQMMRCLDHPTMIKDGSGWGAMAGVSAALLASRGFTGAPAITVTGDDHRNLWSDLGMRWYMNEQYIKLYPVCRWAQPAIQAALELHRQHNFTLDQIETVQIGTFHEAAMLATRTPVNTEQAQYSLPFPLAVALKHQDVGVQHIEGEGLLDLNVLELSQRIELHEVEAYNEAFPLLRISDLTLTLNDGRCMKSGPVQAPGDPEMPVSDEVLIDKFYRLTIPVLGQQRASAVVSEVMMMGSSTNSQSLDTLWELLYAPLQS